jgi:hypothetical protein
MKVAPIVILAYKRVDHLRKTLEAIRENPLAAETDLIVYSDGPKNPENKADIEAIRTLREMVLSEQWCKNVKLISAEKNKGLNDAFFDGITEVMNSYGKAIVLEEDIVVSKHFLDYMNQALTAYENNKNVFHIAGYSFNINNKKLNETYFLGIPNTWGWATWKDRWDKLNRDPKELLEQLTQMNAYNLLTVDGAEPDYWNQLVANAEGKMNTWDIKWVCSVCTHNGLTLYPKWSLAQNIGFDGSGSNFKKGDFRFSAKVNSNKIHFEKQEIRENPDARKALHNFFKKIQPGIFQRAKEKLFLIFTGKLPQ